MACLNACIFNLNGDIKMKHNQSVLNGYAKVIAFHSSSQCDFALCYLDSKDEYVTWRVADDDSFYSGNYFKNYGEALTDFENRIRKYFYSN